MYGVRKFRMHFSELLNLLGLLLIFLDDEIHICDSKVFYRCRIEAFLSRHIDHPVLNTANSII